MKPGLAAQVNSASSIDVKRRIVISAINISEGGMLTVLRDCLAGAVSVLRPEWEIIALVHDRRLVDIPGLRMLEFPLSKRSWLLRLYYEFWRFRQLSTRLRPDVWLSLHDTSPWVKARRQVVYCHNSSPFYRVTGREAWWEPKLLLFNLLYRYLYRFNIHSNTYVVVQQGWLRDAFSLLYGVKDVVVAYPLKETRAQTMPTATKPVKQVFLYPALPRAYKNLEVVCEAAAILAHRNVTGFEIRLTISGQENRYATAMVKRYGSIPGVSFIGRQNIKEMDEQYQACTVVIFPSRLESWGLPISEAKAYGKALMVADLPYAHETVGTYNSVAFFDPANPEALADMMQAEIEDRSVVGPVKQDKPAPPFTRDWPQLIRLLTKGIG